MKNRAGKILQELVGRKIKQAKVSSTGLSMELEFTDGTSFSFVVDAPPTVDIMFAFSGRDGDAIHGTLEES